MPRDAGQGRQTTLRRGDFLNNVWQSILFGILLIIVGWVIASVESEPAWLYPAMGLTFVGGGVVTFISTLKS